jgi:hypothetical protein
VAELASTPEMAERRKLWKRHNSLKSGRPMILIFPEGAWRELLPDSSLRCTDSWARSVEWNLRHRIYMVEHFQSDNVVDADWEVGKAIHDSGWGVEAQWHMSPDALGARTFQPVIMSRDDLKKLKHPVITYDETATMQTLKQVQDLFGDILEIKLKGVGHISFHPMSLYTSLRGLEQVMVDMCEEPEMLHEAMAFIRDGYLGMVRQYVEQNLLSLNNDNTYHSSGGNGWTDELPAKGFDPNRVRTIDMWASAESQELAQVSPAMHAEFALAYEKPLLAMFALNGYGCCEDLTRKLDAVLTIKGIRRISISPWANVDRCAEQLGNKAIFSWKPHPAHLVGEFDAAAIRDYIQHTVDVAKASGCTLEMILKDTHTCQNQPQRFDEWTKIARKIVEA